ncbi:MAG: 5'/3'-nucleotidase SurE [Chitinispirillaceae bacterium]|nr:5'/3'-nucleotidase SurE [Chitinispirillaceae bacterium]
MGETKRKKTVAPFDDATILLTNDDGIAATGIDRLYRALAARNRVVVAAPDSEQSGVGHAFTFNRPLHYERAPFCGGADAYTVSGTPVDCVKFAVSVLMPRRPAAVVAGMNIGENSGLSAFYSGTVAAAREGAFWDIPSIAFSLCQGGERHLNEYAMLAADLLFELMKHENRKKNHRVYYNVNFPACALERCRGLRITTQSMAFFDDRYETIDVENHHTKKGFVIYGEKKDIERSATYDSRALMNNFTTITPLCFDATASITLRDRQHLKRRLRLKGLKHGQ